MRKQLEEKSLVSINQKSFFYKIKIFFKKLFKGKNIIESQTQTEAINNNENQMASKQKDAFIESIKNTENEETKLLKLQEQYDKGEIQENQLSKEQILELEELYKKQISELEKSNENRKRKILQHKDGETFLASIRNIENEETKLLKLQKQYDNGEIKETDLSDEQIRALTSLYKKQIANLSKSNEIRKQKLFQYRKNMKSA